MGTIINMLPYYAVAFSRNSKTRRVMEDIYDQDKDFYYEIAVRHEHYKSRIIIANSIEVQMSAQKALGVLIIGEDNNELNFKIINAAKNGFRNVYRIVKTATNKLALSEIINRIPSTLGTEDLLQDTISMYMFFCATLGIEMDEEDRMFQKNVFNMMLKLQESIFSFGELMRKFIAEQKKEAMCEELIKEVMKKINGAHSLAEYDLGVEKITTFHSALWSISLLENVPFNIIENQVLSKREIKEIFYCIVMEAENKEVPIQEAVTLYFVALIIKSYSKLYIRAKQTIETYTNIIKNTPEHQQLLLEKQKLEQMLSSRKKLLDEKQGLLNTMQIEQDRLKKQLAEKDAELEREKEQNEILFDLLAREKDIEDQTEVDVSSAKEAKVIVFGGREKWQSRFRSIAEGYKFISVEDYDFSMSILREKDIIVINYGYLSHSQYYKIIDYARKKKKKIVYCTDNIQKTLIRIAEVIQ